MKVLETDRLILRRLSADSDADAQFILRLLNEPSWLKFIGDRGVRTVEDARDYIERKLSEMFRRTGFGFYLVESKADGLPLGICGLIKRDSLADVDIGFAFLPEHWGQGYAYESAAAVMDYGQRAFGLKRLVAITTPDNHSSARLLERLGFSFERTVKLPDDEEELRLFACDLTQLAPAEPR